MINIQCIPTAAIYLKRQAVVGLHWVDSDGNAMLDSSGRRIAPSQPLSVSDYIVLTGADRIDYAAWGEADGELLLSDAIPPSLFLISIGGSALGTSALRLVQVVPGLEIINIWTGATTPFTLEGMEYFENATELSVEVALTAVPTTIPAELDILVFTALTTGQVDDLLNIFAADVIGGNTRPYFTLIILNIPLTEAQSNTLADFASFYSWAITADWWV